MQKSPRFKSGDGRIWFADRAAHPLEPTRAPIAGRSGKIDQTKEAIRG